MRRLPSAAASINGVLEESARGSGSTPCDNIFSTARSSLAVTAASKSAPVAPLSDTSPVLLQPASKANTIKTRSEEHTSELQSRPHLVCRLLLEKKNNIIRV